MTLFSAGVLLNISQHGTGYRETVRGKVRLMFKKYQHIHFVGIGGVGMSGIAEVLLTLGYRVTGSDARRSDTVERLERLGAKVYLGHEAAHVEGAHVVVYSSAVARDNVEVQAARQRGVPVIGRAEMLAELMRLKYGIAIAGTHGKTTTTSMVAAVLGAGGFDPTVVVGGRVHGLGANARLGQGEFLVAEADESDGSFLKLSPTIAVVTTVDAEHLDHYADLDAIVAAFLTFVNKVPFYGAAVVCLDDPNIQRMIPRIEKRVVTYGLEAGADLMARRLSFAEMRSEFEAVHRGKSLGPVTLQVPGRHNVLNALAAAAVGLDLEMPFDKIQTALASFAGVQRRFQIQGEAQGVLVVDDYGHHPAEIRATLAAAKAGFDRRVITVFQPHRYSRTQHLLQRLPDRVLPVRRPHRHGHLCGGRGADSRRPRARSCRRHRGPRAPGGALPGRRPRGHRRLPVRIHQSG